MKSYKKIFGFIILILSFIFFLKTTVNAQLKLEDIAEDDEPTISMDLQDANLKDILKIFSIQSGLNFIASEEVENRKITLFLDKVPMREAMEKLFKANKLTYEYDDAANIYTVKYWGKPEVEKITKVYKLKYRNVSSSKMEQEKKNLLPSDSSSSDSSSTSGSTTTSSSGSMASEETSSNDVVSAVKQVLTKDGKVIEDSGSNSIIVTDIPSVFPVIDQVINNLDLPQPQVMLEVEMLDVSKDKIDKLGLEYGEQPFTFGITYASAITQFPLRFLNNSGIKTIAEDDVFDDRAFQPGKISFGDYSVALNFLKKQTDTKFLARPRILTMNNETAEISITKDQIVTKKTTRVVDDSGNTNYETDFERATSLTLTPEGIGIFLRVTPSVNLELGEITMVVNPKTSSASESPYVTDTSTIALDPEVRTTKSVIKVRDGETIVLGGLIHQERDGTKTSLPLLSKIPILGALFRSKDIGKNVERELLVFITPHIIKDAQLTEALKNRDKRIASIDNRGIYSSTKYNLIDTTLNTFEQR